MAENKKTCAGQPKFEIDPIVVAEYLRNGTCWKDIASFLETTPKTLRFWRDESSFVDKIYSVSPKIDQIDSYNLKGHKWVDIAGMMCTSSRLLRKFRKKHNYKKPGNTF